MYTYVAEQSGIKCKTYSHENKHAQLCGKNRLDEMILMRLCINIQYKNI